MITLRGHAQPVTSLNIHNSPDHTLVTGAADRRSVCQLFDTHFSVCVCLCLCVCACVCVYRVRVFDRRSSQPVATLSGHQGTVISTQCDDWKVTSGG